MSVIDQLVRIYLDEETWHTKKLSKEEAEDYYKIAFQKDRIRYFEKEEKILGYFESWRINFDAFGRILCHLPFNIKEEEIQSGPICYVEAAWIKPEYRRSSVFYNLRLQFFRQNHDAEFFVGEAFRKKSQPLKVMRRQHIEKWLKEPEVSLNGKG